MADPLRLVLVTPEKTLLDQTVSSLRLPMFDGQVGILPGRAPFVGRLGVGELRIDEKTSYFIDGGFAQMDGATLSVLTDRAILGKDLDSAAISKDFAAAKERVSTTADESAARTKELERLRAMTRVAANA